MQNFVVQCFLPLKRGARYRGDLERLSAIVVDARLASDWGITSTWLCAPSLPKSAAYEPELNQSTDWKRSKSLPILLIQQEE